MISDNIEITVHIGNLAHQLKLQLGMFGVASLFISYNIKAKYVCVRVCITASEKFISIYL